jgi:putative transposase
MSRSRYRIFENDFPYFLTATIIDWLPLFTNPDIVRIVLDSMTFLQSNDRWTIYAYVIMENHLHLIVASKNLSKEIGDFKSYTARTIIDFYKSNYSLALKSLSAAKMLFKKDREYQFWQEGSHPEQIQSREMMRQKVEYIHYNPVRRGYVDDPEVWRYSSARSYAGKNSLIQVSMDW